MQEKTGKLNRELETRVRKMGVGGGLETSKLRLCAIERDRGGESGEGDDPSLFKGQDRVVMEGRRELRKQLIDEEVSSCPDSGLF